MTKMNALKQLIVTIAVSFLFAINNGMAQTGNDAINSIYFDNIVRLAVEVLNDSSISIAQCEVPVDPSFHSRLKVVFDSGGGVKHYSGSPIPVLKSIVIRDLLRGSVNIDSLIILALPLTTNTGRIENKYPLVNLSPRSKWIIFFDSPYLRSRDYHESAMELLAEYEKKLEDHVNLNPDIYFAGYKNAGALCTYFPEDAKYPPMFKYSEGLVDDFRTLIELRENQSLLSESSDSYENYYNSLQEELGRRVFSQLFENPNQE